MSYQGFDLLGDPIPDSRGAPGRTGHVPTAANAKKIRLLLVANWTIEQIAEELGISAPTLRKHYFRNGRINRKRLRELAIREIKGRTLLQLDQAAEEGKVAAIKAIRDITEKEELGELPAAMKPERRARKPEPKGKKEILRDEAHQPQGDWADILQGPVRPN